jgi:hypothetical protein
LRWINKKFVVVGDSRSMLSRQAIEWTLVLFAHSGLSYRNKTKSVYGLSDPLTLLISEIMQLAAKSPSKVRDWGSLKSPKAGIYGVWSPSKIEGFRVLNFLWTQQY